MGQRVPMIRTLAVAVLVLASAGIARAADEKKVTFQDDVLPVFRSACLNCHNPDKKKGGLDLSSFTGTMAGGGGGAVIEPGDAGSSSLFAVVNHDKEPKMPPNADKLTADKLDVIRKWIEGGVLENSGSKALKSDKPKLDLSLGGVPTGKPEGPPPMPEDLRLEPYVKTRGGNPVAAIASSPWAPVVAIAGQKQVALYNPDTLDILGVLPFGHAIPEDVRFSRNGGLIIVAGGRGAAEGFAELFDVTTGKKVTRVGEEFNTALTADLSSDQSKIAIGTPAKVLKVYGTADGQLLYTMTKHTDWVTATAFSPDSVLLASGDRAGNVMVWEAFSGREFYALRGHNDMITSVAFRADSNILATASEDGTIRLWNMTDGNQIKSWGAHGGGVLAMMFGNDGRIVSAGRDSNIKVWDANGNQQRAIKVSEDMVTAVSFNHDGSRAIAGDYLGNVTVWNTADGQRLGNLEVDPITLEQRIALTSQHIAEAKQALEAKQKEYVSADEQRQQMVNKRDEQQKQLQTMHEQVAAAEKQMASKQSEFEAAGKAVEEADQKRNAANEQMKQMNEAMNALRQQADAKRKEQAEAANQMNKMTGEHEQAVKAAEAAEQAAKEQPENAELVQKATETRNKETELSAALEQQKGTVDKLTGEMNQMNEQVAAREKEVADHRGTLDQMNQDVQAMREDSKQKQEAMNEARKIHGELKQKLPQQEKTVEEMVKRAEEMTNAANEKKVIVEEVAVQVQNFESRLKRWQAAQFNLKVLEAQQALEAKQVEFEQHQAEHAAMDSQYKSAMQQLAILEKQLEAGPSVLQTRRSAIESAAGATTKAIESRDALLPQAAAKDRLIDEVQSMRDHVAAAADNEAIKLAVAKMDESLAALRQDRDAFVQIIEQHNTSIVDSSKTIVAAISDHDQAVASIDALPAKIGEQNQVVTAAKQALDTAAAKLQPFVTARDEAQQKHDALRAKYEEMKTAG